MIEWTNYHQSQIKLVLKPGPAILLRNLLSSRTVFLVDAYLIIAEAVLRAARRPLSPRSIMNAAFKAGIVPEHLFGKAQHKTLHARLSEDILDNKLESRFFR